MLNPRPPGRVCPVQRGRYGEMFNIIVVVLSGLRRLVFCGPEGGSDGQEGVGPGRVRAARAACGGVRELAEVAGVFALSGSEQTGYVSWTGQPCWLEREGLGVGELRPGRLSGLPRPAGKRAG
jgi:hypothetical protein